jgi:mannose-6-phosphate isomerase-like protein (cupin superfamily)
MHSFVRRVDETAEFMTPERCWILEAWNNDKDAAVSIARARVAPGVTTQLHRLRGVDERYLIVAGSGLMKIGTLDLQKVGPGDVAFIPAGVPQQITSDGKIDLMFYCICTPPFRPGCYESLEESERE